MSHTHPVYGSLPPPHHPTHPPAPGKIVPPAFFWLHPLSARQTDHKQRAGNGHRSCQSPLPPSSLSGEKVMYWPEFLELSILLSLRLLGDSRRSSTITATRWRYDAFKITNEKSFFVALGRGIQYQRWGMLLLGSTGNEYLP